MEIAAIVVLIFKDDRMINSDLQHFYARRMKASSRQVHGSYALLILRAKVVAVMIAHAARVVAHR